MASLGGGGGDEAPKLRVFFIPFFVSSHMLPMLDLARLFAAHPGMEPTMVVTPANAAVLRPALALSAAAGRPVKLLLYPFPSVGLPDGVESLSTAPAAEGWRVHRAVDLSRGVHEELLRLHRPDAVVADVPFWWTTGIAAELGIPRITHHVVGVFPQLALNNLFDSRQIFRSMEASEAVTVPGLPGPVISLPVSELPLFMRVRDQMTESWDRMKKAQLESHGVVVNTFYELESEYCDLYRRIDARRAWFVGPVSLPNMDGTTSAVAAAVEEDSSRCRRWLDSKAEMSVVYICFGSWCRFSAAQLREMAAGLEASGQPFLWVATGGAGGKAEEWTPEGWEERVGERGLVVRGWAPQVAILGHPAVGAFLTHCGWNSVMEAAAAGVPVLTWPLAFEQFLNERLVVEVLGMGARVWHGFRSMVEEEKAVVPAAAISEAVVRFMRPGGEGGKARRRAGELAAAARAAVTVGGSSRNDLNSLIDELWAAKEVPRGEKGDPVGM